MKTILLILIFFFIGSNAIAQESKNTSMRFIEVTGSAEQQISPDEIIIIIKIEEYWEEEFEEGKEFEDYKNKVSLEDIEEDFISDLEDIGISKDRLIVNQAGSNWRYRGKEILMSKQFKLSIVDFGLLDRILRELKTRGISQIRIAELINQNIIQYRKQVKIEALKAAQKKAEYLLESIGKKAGDFISIIELDKKSFWSQRDIHSNTVMSSNNRSGSDSFRTIDLRYEVKVKFEIINN